jgi:modification methylase
MAKKKGFETNVIHDRDCSNMEEIPGDVIDLIISGPPYWSFIDYHAYAEGKPHLWQGIETYETYLSSLERWHSECFRVLRPGRYCIVNLATLERNGKTYPIPFHALPIMEKIGFRFEFEIVWNKISGGRQRARNFIRNPVPGRFTPNIRTEYLLVFRKSPDTPFRGENRLEETSRIQKVEVDDFFVREVANNIWNIPPQSSNRERKHPCPFPMEIPTRLIELFSQEREVILDPFIGIGTTAVAAHSLNRRFVGYEIEEKFRTLAEQALLREPRIRTQTVCEYRSW